MQRGIGFSHDEIVAHIKEYASNLTGLPPKDLMVSLVMSFNPISNGRGEISATVLHADGKSHLWGEGRKGIYSIDHGPSGRMDHEDCRGCLNMNGLACEICLLDGGKKPDPPHEPTSQEREDFFESEIDETTCRKCGGEMVRGQALINTPFGIPDFEGTDGMVATMSMTGPPDLVLCLKCSLCGWSVQD